MCRDSPVKEQIDAFLTAEVQREAHQETAPDAGTAEDDADAEDGAYNPGNDDDDEDDDDDDDFIADGEDELEDQRKTAGAKRKKAAAAGEQVTACAQMQLYMAAVYCV